MISDEERREVARMLRELPGDSTYPDLIGVIADHDGWYPAADAADRLADLIEPGEPKVKCVAEVKIDGEQLEKLVHDAVVEHIGVDREALLALADKVVADTEEDVRSEDLVPAWQAGEVLRDVASKIREACGEEGA